MSNATNAPENELTFEQALGEVEQELQALKERYTQVQQAELQQAELQLRLQAITQEQQAEDRPQLKVELKQIQQQLEVLELDLESRLFNWRSLREPFWQAVRFGGLGVTLGWLLKSCAA
ncbi:hypothetical protein DO97_01045 [Neosynechococcus sphagnicola sy1]|uniref:DUF2203 domain-containing protein n=1 Tax=Neosynechococcus sphagnicola sy1 TaxID=1497020 RepID=A0A098TLV9_9CYAN|nr:hypothetical protein [Neosynechococcus sphagnicola]KGF73246.1 hypothetical protein DO97_01045 [Neosynechococcus sphagnicola sy1]